MFSKHAAYLFFIAVLTLLILHLLIAPVPAQREPQRVDPYGDPLPTGAIARIGTLRWWFERRLDYSADGKRLFTLRHGEGVVILDAVTGKELQRIGEPDSTIDGYELSVDRKRMAVFTDGSSKIGVWNVEDLLPVKVATIDRNEVGHVYYAAMSPDGKLLAVQNKSQAVRVWSMDYGNEVAKLQILSPFEKNSGSSRLVGFLANSKTVLVALRGLDQKSRQNGAIRREPGFLAWWDVESGRSIKKQAFNNLQFDQQVSLSPDGKRVFVAETPIPVNTRKADAIYVLDAETGKEIRHSDPAQPPHYLRFSPDGQMLVGCITSPTHKWQGAIVFFDTDSGKLNRRLTVNVDEPWPSLALSPDGKTLAMGSSHTLQQIDGTSGKIVTAAKGLSAYVAGVRFTKDGDLLVSCLDGRTDIWDPRTGAVRNALPGPPENLHGVVAKQHTNERIGETALSSNGKLAAMLSTSSGYNVTLEIWNLQTGELLSRQKDVNRDDIRLDDVRFARNSVHLLEESGQVLFEQDGRSFALADTVTGKIAFSLSISKKKLDGRDNIGLEHMSHVVSADGSVLAANRYSFGGTVFFADFGQTFKAWDDPVHLFDLKTGKELSTIDHEDGYCLALSPKGEKLVMAKIPTKAPKGELGGKADAPTQIKLSIWDTQTGKQAFAFAIAEKSIDGALFSPDGRTLAYWSEAVIHLVDITTGKEQARFEGHRDVINSLAFSDDGRMLASGSSDRTVLVWDLAGIGAGKK